MSRVRLAVCIAISTTVAMGGIVQAGGNTAAVVENGDSLVSAQEILDRAVDTYLGCQSYRDRGLVRIVIFESRGERVVERPFETAFERNGRFRFEFADRDMLGRNRIYIVWTDGQDVLTWWDLKPEIESKGSLSAAIAGATGVSGGSAHRVPVLLMPDRVSGRSPAYMTDLERHANEIVESVECFTISGDHGGHQTTLWIDTSSFLIRRTAWEMEGDGFRAERTTTYDPAIDIEIPAEDLAFEPPVVND